MATAQRTTEGLTSPWASLGGLFFAAKRTVQGVWAGRHAGSATGVGLDFHDYRAYAPGDPLQRIDWKVFGRTNRLYVRRYRRMSDLPLCLLVDCSASMAFSGLDARGRPLEASGRALSKWRWASLLASSLAYLAVRQSDQVSLGLAGNGLLGYQKPGGSWGHLQKVIATLEQQAYAPGEGRLDEALRAFHDVLPRRGLLVVISDLLDDPQVLLDGLARFRHRGFEMVVFQVLTPQELDFTQVPNEGYLLTDLEKETSLAVQPRAVAARYNDLMRAHVLKIKHACPTLRADYCLARTSDSVVSVLRSYLSKRRST